jgi:cytochrome c peroxidase
MPRQGERPDRGRTRKRQALSWIAILTCCPEVAQSQEPQRAAYVWQLPRGFPIPAVPADNPMSEEKVALGRRLFFEPRLSITGRDSCASCHDPALSFSDGRAVAVGALGDALPHSAMALVNVAYNISFGWTKPQLRSLEAQMREPLLSAHPVELGLAGREASVNAQLALDRTYAAGFAAAFPEDGVPITFDHVVKAIAAFERTLISGRSAFDRYVFDGDHTALSDPAKRGMALFFSHEAGCSGCHSGINFAGNWRDSQGETGKPAFANNGTSEQPMRVPTLRNVALTAPYMHDGRFATLAAVLDYYSGLGERARMRDDRVRGNDANAAHTVGHRVARAVAHATEYDPRLPQSAFSVQQRADLNAFLNSLTDEAFAHRFAAVDSMPVGERQ